MTSVSHHLVHDGEVNKVMNIRDQQEFRVYLSHYHTLLRELQATIPGNRFEEARIIIPQLECLVDKFVLYKLENDSPSSLRDDKKQENKEQE